MSGIDVFVIGGGPAGLAAAIAAANKGLRVVVADGERPPIDKPCGEGLMPDSRELAKYLGVETTPSMGYEFRGIRFVSENTSVAADFSRGPGIGIRRTTLHRALLQAAESAGVECRWNTPISGTDKLRARWIIGADGSSSLVRRCAGLEAISHSSRRYAFRRHFAIAPWSEYMEIHWSEGCQLYVTPVDSSEVCVALVSRQPGLRLDEALRRHFPAIHARAASRECGRERGSVTGNVTLRAVARGKVALIGDASGSVDAIAGEGICLAFRQAQILAKAIVDGDLSAYNRQHRRLAMRPRLMAGTMLQLDRGQFFRNSAMSLLSLNPWLFGQLLRLHTA